MKLSLSTAYAVGALLRLSEYPNETPVSCPRLAADGEMPERFLLQVLRNLVVHGELKSTRGSVGGYRLTRPLNKITLQQVVEAMNEVETPVVPDVPALSGVAKSRLLDTLKTANSSIAKALSSLTLAELKSDK